MDFQTGCAPFLGNQIPAARMDPYFYLTVRDMPPPSLLSPDNTNGAFVAAGAIPAGSTFAVDAGNNALLSRFGAFLRLPCGSAKSRSSTFKLYVDGKLVTSKAVTYRVGLQ